MSSSESYFIPVKQQPRLTAGEVASGVSFAEKGVDAGAPIQATDLAALTAPNPSGHGGERQRIANVMAQVQPEINQQEANIRAEDAAAAQQGGGAS